ncbi:MAG: type II secretion system F family protein, partial [Actinobacteria bacterium]|nr:type II secretion system F family protein [Actinomycetota bacterium]
MISSKLMIPFLFSLSGSVMFFAPENASDILRKSRRRVTQIRDTSGVRDRLTMLGREEGYERFRLKQVSRSCWSSLVTFLVSSSFQSSLTFTLIVTALGAFGVFTLEDRKLSSQVRKQRLQIEAEFASVIEMMTLALSAGDTPMGALTRISQRSNGRLSQQLEVVIESVRSGFSFHVAIDQMGKRIESVQIRRFIDALITAIMRGAPLTAVLHTHVAEARSIQKI